MRLEAAVLALVALTAGADDNPVAAPLTALKLLSHNNSPTEVLVYTERGNRGFVEALLRAVAGVNAGRAVRREAPVSVLGAYKTPGEGLGALRRRWRDRVPLDFVPVASRMDVWLQDVAEIGAAGGVPVLLGTARGRGLDRLVPALAARWGGTWTGLPAPAPGAANGAGNLEALPYGLVMIGATAGPGLRRFLAGQGYGRSLVELDTLWLEVGHVDEIVSHVVLDGGACGLALLRASPGAALDLLRHTPARDLPRRLRRAVGSAGDDGAFHAGQTALEQRLERIEAGLLSAIARRRPACRSVPVVRLPVLFRCAGSPGQPRRCRPLTPNTANLVVLDRHVLVPDPGIDAFRGHIAERLRVLGQTPVFLDDRFYQRRRGGVHCATNVRRSPRVLLNPELESNRVSRAEGGGRRAE